MCIACALHADFSIFLCGKCDKPTSLQHWSGRWDELRQRLCTGCVPEAAIIQCYCCKKTQSLQCFALKYPAVETSSMQLIRVVTRYEVAETHFDVFRCYRHPQPKYIASKEYIYQRIDLEKIHASAEPPTGQFGNRMFEKLGLAVHT